MSFADWKKRSKLFAAADRILDPYDLTITNVCQAAYKAGERDGRKRAEDAAERAAKRDIELREIMRVKG